LLNDGDYFRFALSTQFTDNQIIRLSAKGRATISVSAFSPDSARYVAYLTVLWLIRITQRLRDWLASGFSWGIPIFGITGRRVMNQFEAID
jgi:hypothetical protein